ncbi:MAG: MBL fold metallo-hydrolase, partial [Limisphaerales bacterium]
MQFTILGSGSTGNCAYLETDDVRLLIDAGFSGKQIRERLASINRTPERLTGILVTHEHSDHSGGVERLCAHHSLPVWTAVGTARAVFSPDFE